MRTIQISVYRLITHCSSRSAAL